MPPFARSLTLISLAVAVGTVTADEPTIKPFGHDPYSRKHCFAVSRDGTKVALGCWVVWDIPTGKRLLEGKTRGAWAMDFSPDGNLLAVGGNYSEFFVYDTKTGKVAWDLTLVGHGDTILNHFEFTPDGRHLVSSSDNGMLRVWDLKTRKAEALFCFKSEWEFNNGWEKYLKAWRAVAGNRPPDDVKTFALFDKPIKQISKFAITPDGKAAAVALTTPEVPLLELGTGKILKWFETGQVASTSARFSGDGKLLAIGGGDERPDTGRCTIEIWDVATGERLVTCRGHQHSVHELAFSPDNKLLLSGGGPDGAFLWDVATGKEKLAVHQDKETYVAGVAFLPDGKTFLTLPHTQGEVVHFWDTATGKPVSPIEKKGPK